MHEATNTATVARTLESSLPAIAEVPDAAWRALAEQTIEPNGYQLPDWVQAIAASARGGAGAMALTTSRGDRLTALMPVVSLWSACRVPLPGLVNVDPHTSLGTPLLGGDDDGAASLLACARRSGARTLYISNVTLEGPTLQALRAALARDGLAPIILQSHLRACLDATQDAEETLRSALGAKKLKEMRRLRHRLAAHGDVVFDIASTPQTVAAALPAFLDLEAKGWKGAQGSALKQHIGNLAFIERATIALAALGQCHIFTLRAGNVPVAAGVVLRHLDRAFFFKIAVDPAYARYSVGVQLTLELTRHLCNDPAIALADSTAAPDHPMIDPIWRGRLAIGDVLIPLRRRDPIIFATRVALQARLAIRTRLRRVVYAIRRRRR